MNVLWECIYPVYQFEFLYIVLMTHLTLFLPMLFKLAYVILPVFWPTFTHSLSPFVPSSAAIWHYKRVTAHIACYSAMTTHILWAKNWYSFWGCHSFNPLSSFVLHGAHLISIDHTISGMHHPLLSHILFRYTESLLFSWEINILNKH